MIRYLLPILLLATPALAQIPQQGPSMQDMAARAAFRVSIEREQFFDQIEQLQAMIQHLQAEAKKQKDAAAAWNSD